MVTVSSPPPPLANPSVVEETDEVDVRKMDGLLEQLKTSMVELIVQGDDVTHQMWRMYSVFEEIFGRQTMTTSSNQPLKHVVVGLKTSSSSSSSPPNKATHPPPPPPTSPTLTKATTPPPLPSSSTVTKVTTTAAALTPVSSAAAQLSSPTSSTPTCSSSKDVKDVSPEKDHSPTSPQNKNFASVATPSPKSSLPTSGRSSSSPGLQSGHLLKFSNPSDSDALSTSLNPTSNPLLDTIGALANSNQDSDDSDLDIVYQQLKYRQRKPEQMRMRTHRTHRHHQVASSDPESIGYAGSNSIDSGYKSLCATPEVSDSLSAPEVRRSASDVSASDSSTTSGRPRSLDGQDGKSTKIKMGTRSVAGKLKPMSPRHVSATATMNDVTLDHLMYLRQSLRKDRSSPIDSIPSSATSSTFRDSDLSPRPLADDEWRESSPRPPPYPFRPTSASSSPADPFSRNNSPRSCSVDQEGGGESSSDFLLSGVEYYDLESIQEFPTHNYVTMMHEEKTRCSRMVSSAPRSSEPFTERQLSSLYRKRSESTQSVDGDISRPHHHQNIYGMAGHPSRPARNSAKALSSRHHHHSRQHHATDSKLTEAAIRVLEMIEDFRMEEAMTRSGRMLPYQEQQGAAPSDIHHHQQTTVLPRYSRKAGRRPASTGSLMEQEIDARSVASYAASAEHHVYEEIMYDLVCERGMERGMMPPPPPERGGRVVSRSRLLPVVPPQRHHQQQAYASSVCVDPRRIMVRSSHKHSRSNMYSVLSSSSAHGRSNMDRFVEREWHLAQQDRRDSLPPDFPV